MPSRKRSGAHDVQGADDAFMMPRMKRRRRADKEEPGDLDCGKDTADSMPSQLDQGDLVDGDKAEVVNDDDLCPICQLLIHEPVKTECNHTMCRSCMATWADVSLSQSMVIVPVSEEADEFDAVSGIEACCPMCRTHTTASPDASRLQQLQDMYPKASAQRANDEDANDESEHSIQTVTLYIGNQHCLLAPRGQESPNNSHEWTFFVRPSRTEIIEEIQIFLHPTFRPRRVVRQRPPYEIRRSGWGIFTIEACIILKAGYSWVSSDAEDSPDGAIKGLLRLEWTLTFDAFDGTGAMGRCRLKVKNDRDWEDISDEEERDEAEWNRAVRQYQRDGNYVPPPED